MSAVVSIGLEGKSACCLKWQAWGSCSVVGAQERSRDTRSCSLKKAVAARHEALKRAAEVGQMPWGIREAKAVVRN